MGSIIDHVYEKTVQGVTIKVDNTFPILEGRENYEEYISRLANFCYQNYQKLYFDLFSEEVSPKSSFDKIFQTVAHNRMAAAIMRTVTEEIRIDLLRFNTLEGMLNRLKSLYQDQTVEEVVARLRAILNPDKDMIEARDDALAGIRSVVSLLEATHKDNCEALLVLATMKQEQLCLVDRQVWGAQMNELRRLDIFSGVPVADKQKSNVVSEQLFTKKTGKSHPSFREALLEPDCEKWLQSTASYVAKMHRLGVFEWADLPPGRVAIGNKWCLDNESGAYNSTIFASGSQQECGKDFVHTNSHHLTYTALKLVLQVAAHRKMFVHRVNIKDAALYADLDYTVYMKPCQGYDQLYGNRVWKLRKCVPGLKQTNRQIIQTISKKLRSMKFRSNNRCQSVFSRYLKGRLVIVTLYVDSLLIVAESDTTVDWVKEELRYTFDIEDFGPATKYLGINIDCVYGGISISARDQIEEIVQKFDIPNITSRFPIRADLDFYNLGGKKANATLYRSLLGSLSFIGSTVRYDIAYALCVLSHFTIEPKQLHWQALLQTAQYLINTKNFSIDYGPTMRDRDSINIRCFSKSYQNDRFGDRFFEGFIIKSLQGGVMSWQSRHYQCDTDECEISRVSAHAASLERIEYFVDFYKQLGLRVTCVPILGDCNFLSEVSPYFGCVSSHNGLFYDGRLEMIQEAIDEETIRFQHTSNNEDISWLVTCALDRDTFEHYVEVSERPY